MTEGPERLGRYLVLDASAVALEGGRQRLKAVDPELDRRVTIELFSKDEGRDSVSSVRALRVGQVLAGLDHPNLQRVFDVGFADGRVFFAFERAGAQTLERWAIGRPWREVVSAFAEAGAGLAEAHRHGLVHGSFSAELVTVDADDHCKLGGFVAAAASAASLEDPPTSQGDQVALVTALAGALGRTVGRVPAWVNTVVERGRAADPTKRFPDAEALVAALHQGLSRPRRTRRLIGLASGLLVIVTVIVGALVRDRARCVGGAGSLDGAWDDGVRATMQEAFGAVSRPFALDVRASVFQRLDEVARRWTAMRATVCATPDSDTRQAQLECLAWWRDELAATTFVLARADATVVENAPSAVDALSIVEECRASPSRRRFGSPASRVQGFDAVRLELARVKALTETGRWKEGVVEAEVLVEHSRGVSQPLLVQALLLRSTLRSRLGEPRKAYVDAREAFLVAMASGDDALSAEASLRAAIMTPAADERARALGVARALVERVGSAQLVHAAQRIEAQRLGTEGKWAEANELFRKVVAYDRATLGVSHYTTLTSTVNAGVTLMESGDLAHAVEVFAEVYEQSLSVFGPRHPRTARYRAHMAMVLLATGELEPAREGFLEALEIHRAMGEENMLVANDLYYLAETDRRRGQLSAALDAIGQASAINTVKGTPLTAAHYDTERGEILLAMGQPHEALDLFSRALAAYERAEGASPKMMPALTGTAVALLSMKRPREALPFAERAAGFEGGRIDRTAAAKVALARALRMLGRDDERGRALAAEALAALQASQVKEPAVLAEAERLLAAYTPSSP